MQRTHFMDAPMRQGKYRRSLDAWRHAIMGWYQSDAGSCLLLLTLCRYREELMPLRLCVL